MSTTTRSPTRTAGATTGPRRTTGGSHADRDPGAGRPTIERPRFSTVRDSGVVAWRNVLNLRRTPGQLVTSAIQPVMFVLLLAFVFGGSLGGPGYREFLIGGILAQTLTFNASFTAVGLANDLHQGLVDRYRSLPMSRAAVILGRAVSDLVSSAISVVVTIAVGLLIGWRVDSSATDLLLVAGLLLLFTFAVSWIGAVIALTSRSVEVAQSLGLIWLFPVTFVSGAFVSVEAMPGPLQVLAEWNPVTAVAAALRELFGNAAPAGLVQPDGWPAEHALLYAVLSSLALVAVFAPVALVQYRRIDRR